MTSNIYTDKYFGPYLLDNNQRFLPRQKKVSFGSNQFIKVVCTNNMSKIKEIKGKTLVVSSRAMPRRGEQPDDAAKD
jgi:hypothetical protein